MNKMIILKTTIISLFILGTLADSAAQANDKFQLITTVNPPYVMEDGKTGFMIDLFEHLFKKAGIPFQLTVAPLKRGLTMTLEKPHACIAPVDRSQALEAQYKWVSPFLITETALYTKGTAPINVSVLADAKGSPIAAHLGSAIEMMLKKMDYNVQALTETSKVPKMLATDRIKFWAEDTLVAPLYAAQSDVKIFESLRIAKTILAMACNPALDDSLILKLNTEVSKLYRDGYMKKLIQKYKSEKK